MSAVDPGGFQKFWVGALPITGLLLTAGAGPTNHWTQARPVGFLYGSTVDTAPAPAVWPYLPTGLQWNNGLPFIPIVKPGELLTGSWIDGRPVLNLTPAEGGVGAGILAGVGSLVAVGSSTNEGVGAFVGTSSVSAAGEAVISGAGTLAGSGVLDAVSPGVGAGAALMEGVGSFDAVAELPSVGTLSGVGTLSAVASIPGVATISGVGSFSAVGGGVVIAVGEAHGTSEVSAVGAYAQPPRLLAPTIDDDGWGGDVSYAWSQVSGPAASITHPTDSATDVAFPSIPGVYVFEITVSRSLDALSGKALARVVIFPSAPSEVEDETNLPPIGGSNWEVYTAEQLGLVAPEFALSNESHPAYAWLIVTRAGKAAHLISAYGTIMHSNAGWGYGPDPTASYGDWVEWDPVPHAESYRLYVADAPDFNPFGGVGSATRARYLDHDNSTVDGMFHPFALTITQWSQGTDALDGRLPAEPPGGEVIITANGRLVPGKIGSTNISSGLGQVATCSFTFYNGPKDSIESGDSLSYDSSIPQVNGQQMNQLADGLGVGFTVGEPVNACITGIRNGKEGPASPICGNAVDGAPSSCAITWIPVVGVDSYRIYFFDGSSFDPHISTGNSTVIRFLTHDNSTMDGGSSLPSGFAALPMKTMVHSWADGTAVLATSAAHYVGEGNDVTLTRDGVRLFGGICISATIDFDEGYVFQSISLVGYAWHLGRERITRTYRDVSLDAIAQDLISFAPGGITWAGRSGFPSVRVVYDDTVIGEALTALTQHVRGLRWHVDHYKRLHFTDVETEGPDPEPLTIYHRKMKNLSLTRTIGSSVNKVRVYYQKPGAPSSIIGSVDAEGNDTDKILIGGSYNTPYLRINSSIGFRPKDHPGNVAAGALRVNGRIVRYRGVVRRPVNQVEGMISLGAKIVSKPGGQLDHRGSFSYRVSLTTSEGETTPITGWAAPALEEPQPIYQQFQHPTGGPGGGPWIETTDTVIGYSEPGGSYEIMIYGVQGPDARMKRVTGINVYRDSQFYDPFAPGDTAIDDQRRGGTAVLVTSLSARGGAFTDSTARINLAPTLRPRLGSNADILGYFLDVIDVNGQPPGPTGMVDPEEENDHEGLTGEDLEEQLELEMENAPAVGSESKDKRKYVELDDLSAQAEMSTRLGGGSGVISVSIDAGEVLEADAYILGQAYLNAQREIQTTVNVTVRDANAQPGQMLDIHLPEPIGEAHLRIQTVGIRGFELGVPHEYDITATENIITLEDLLKAFSRVK